MNTKWVLAYIDNDTCDECGRLASVNVYRKEVGVRLYRFFAVCAICLDHWLKRQTQYSELD